MRGSFYEKVMIAHRSAPCFMPSTLAATEASRAAWAVEMRLRAVRLAETEKEKADAIAALTDIVRRYDLAVAAE